MEDFRRRMGALAVILMAVLATPIIIYSLLHKPAPIEIGQVNGRYRNPDCGVVSFKNGVLASGTYHARYSLERDKEGLFAVSDAFVGVYVDNDGHCSFSVDHYHSPLKMRFDSENQPQSVELLDSAQNEIHAFVRVARHSGASQSRG